MPTVIPFGDRILVTKKPVGEKLGKEKILLAPDTVKERDTDLARIVHIPDNSFADDSLIGNADSIIEGLTSKAKDGDSQALIALLQFRTYLNIKSLKVGDDIMIGKYVGTGFEETTTGKQLTLISGDEVIGLVNYEEGT